MKRGALLISVLTAFSMFVVTGVWFSASAEDETFLNHEEIFGKLLRPPVPFDHDVHMDALDEEGCGVCHHVYDEDKGGLIYEDGEEMSCTECHGRKKGKHEPALREAYHGNCTVCHRRMARNGGRSGPVTCGECHER